MDFPSHHSPLFVLFVCAVSVVCKWVLRSFISTANINDSDKNMSTSNYTILARSSVSFFSLHWQIRWKADISLQTKSQALLLHLVLVRRAEYVIRKANIVVSLCASEEHDNSLSKAEPHPICLKLFLYSQRMP